MTRDDSVLYSGASSASFSSVKEQKVLTTRKDKKEEQRNQLKPSADVTFQVIDKEIDSVLRVDAIDISSAKDERLFMIEMMARQKYVEYLHKLKARLTIVLREPKTTSKEESDDEQEVSSRYAY